MTATVWLLAAVVIFYSGYNLFIKVSSDHAPESATSLILATIVLQLTALMTSAVFATSLVSKGSFSLSLNMPTYLWAALAGVCIGAAEIAYFYIFKGVAGAPPLGAGIVIPVIVAGTVVVTTFVSVALFAESISFGQLAGLLLVVTGLFLLIRL